MDILGLIPARAGSERIKNKNIKLLNNKPLVTYTIECALQSKLLTKVVVSTDSEEIARIAKSLGAEVPFTRPKNLATSSSTELEFHQHALTELHKLSSFRPDLIVNLYPTSPFRKPSSIDTAINYLIDNPSYDSLRSVTKCTEHPYKMWVQKNKQIIPFVKSESNQSHTLSYQLLPKVFIQNACIYISRYETIVEKKSTIGNMVLGFEMDPIEAIDINTELDFMLAELLLGKISKQHND